MIALFYDIHGNLPALEAVLVDAAAAGAERHLLGGDYALFGAWPAETTERLQELETVARVRGNGERWCAHPEDAPEALRQAIDACSEALGAQLVAELDALPAQVELGQTLACHGSPASDVRSFFPEPAEDEPELLAGVSARRLVFGHTHLQFAREAKGGIELVNPGSVGMPFDGDARAAYALIDDDGRVEQRRVGYDHLASAEAVRDRYGDRPWAMTVAGRIERASF